MADIDSVEIKQEFRDDIQDIIENIEDEYDDDDIEIDDSDVSDFLTEDSMNSSDFSGMESSFNGDSSSFNESTFSEIVPKEEPSDVSDELHNQRSEYAQPEDSDEHPENEASNFSTSVRSEIMQEIKTEGQDNAYSSGEQETNSFPQPHLQPSYPPHHKPSYPPQQEPSYPHRQESYPPQQESTYPPKQEPTYPPQQESTYPTQQDPSSHSQQDPSYPPQHQQNSFEGELSGIYPVDGIVKDEYVEDEWKRDIKSENLTENINYEQNNHSGYYEQNNPSGYYEQNNPSENYQQNNTSGNYELINPRKLVQNNPSGNNSSQTLKKPKSGADGWIADNTIPQGWKYKISLGNNKTMVCSPMGKKFDSRKNALKFMKANHYPEEEVAFMDECLKHEGWCVDEYLPEGWKFRRGRQSGIEYMTSDEIIFNSTSGAFQEIQSKYPQEIIKRFQLLTQKNAKKAPSIQKQPVRNAPRPGAPRQPAAGQQWTSDNTIPIGWRICKANGKQMLLSPNGIQFGSRRAAFQELVTKNYPDAMKAEMFDKLAFEGFQANDLLPFGWIYQKTDVGELNFLTREGRLLVSFKNAFEFLISSGECSAEEIQRFQSFNSMTGAEMTPKPVPVVWNENDQTVPLGWKTKPAVNGRQNQKVFLSPDGYELKSRRLALKHMIQFSFPEESVEEMRRFLYYEGWMDDQSLPYLWKMKRNGNMLLFLSREGDVLENSKGAIAYIQKDPYSYSSEDIQRIEYVSSMAQRTVRPNVVQNGIRKNVVQNNRNISQLPAQISVRKVDSSYVEDGSVPKGWKIKNDGTRVSYMAPNGTTYKSRRTAYQAMVQERYPNEEIEAMRKTLKYDGWLDNSELPDGWKVKQMSNNVSLIDRGGELFKSYVEAAKFIETYFQYFTQEDMDKINRLARINQPSRPRNVSSLSSWDSTDSTVPRGWKSKGRCGKGKILMSPQGTIYNSRKGALQQMVKSGASEEQLDEIRISLVHEGWVKMETPKYWMYKPLTAYGYHFLADDGTVLESKGRAQEHLMKAGLLNDENKRSIDMLRGQNKTGGYAFKGGVKQDHSPKQITPDETWILGDLTVPEGWRVKEYEHNGKRFKMVLSPAGLSFRNRRTALSYMVKNNFSPEEVDEIRQGLAHDGWMEDPLLPTNWRFKAKRPQVMYCTDEGEVIISHINAIRKLQTREKFSSEQMADLKQFVDKHGGTRKEYGSGSTPGLPVGSLSKIFENARSNDELLRTLKGLGWMENQYLPANWLFRNRKEGNMHIDVLSAEGTRFISYRQAVIFMRTSENYSESDIDKFYCFPDGKPRGIRMVESKVGSESASAESNDWIENDDSVPKGWKSKLWLGSLTKKCLLSPEGQVFNSRIGAYKYLLKYGTKEQVEEMRALLGCDGWQQYPLLPADWLYKKKDYNNLYLTELGEKLSGNTQAVKIIGDTEKYANKMDDLKSFIAEQKTDKFSSSLNESYNRGGSIGNLRWLVESNADEEQIKKARVDLIEGGWQSNEYLPENWLHKTREGHHNINVLSVEGLKFPSFKAAIQHMRTDNKYTEDTILRFRLFPNGKRSEKLETRFGGRNVSVDDPSWEEGDPTIPKGWKSRKVVGKDVTMLQTPAGIVYWSRRAALKDLLKNGAPSEEIDAIKDSLVHDGWGVFDNLPKGWMYKRKELRSVYLTEMGELVDGHTKAQKLIAEDGQYSVEEQTKIREFVLNRGQTERQSQEGSPKLSRTKSSLYAMLQEKVKTGSEEEKERAREELQAKGWWVNEYLPDGWMSKRFESGQQIYVLSTEGEIFHSYKSVLQHLTSNEKYNKEEVERFLRFPDGKLHKRMEPTKHSGVKYFSIKQYQDAIKKESNMEEVNEIKKYYLEKGWMEDSALLPSMWLFRQKPGFTSLNFLTASGELLLSTKEANKYVERNGIDLVINAKELQAKVGIDYEIEMKRMEKKIKIEVEDDQMTAAVKVEKDDEIVKIIKTEADDVKNFKFYSLEEFDSKTNNHLAEFKGVFAQLESLKKTITPKVKEEPSFNFDLEFDSM